MSWYFCLAILLQLGAISIVARSMRRGRVNYYGFVFIGVAFAYHGASEILNRLLPRFATHRIDWAVSSQFIDAWLIKVSFSMLLFAIAYRFSLRVQPQSPPRLDSLVSAVRLPFVYHAIALAILSYFLSGRAFDAGSSYWVLGLVQAYQYFFIAVSAVLVLSRFAKRDAVFVTIFAILIGLITLIGARHLAVLFTGMICAVLATYGVRFTWAKVISLASVILVSMVVISVARLLFGRESLTDADSLSRLSTMSEAARSWGRVDKDGVVDEFVSRLDANAFGGLLVMSLKDQPPVGFAPLSIAVKLAIPSFLWKSKIDEGRPLNESQAIRTALHLPDEDAAVGWFNVAYSMFGDIGLLVVSLLLGFLLGKMDSLEMGASVYSLLIQIGIFRSIFFWESNLTGIACGVRETASILVFALVLNYIGPIISGVSPAKSPGTQSRKGHKLRRMAKRQPKPSAEGSK